MRHVITLIASPNTLLELAPFVTLLGQHDQCVWLEEGRAADLYYTLPPSPMLQSMLQQHCSNVGVDYVLQPRAGREKLLLISDMDSTMIAQECIDELADQMGLRAHVAAITEQAMRGALDFKTALRERVALLKGLPEAALEEVYTTRITPMAGARTLVQTMRARGGHCVLVSGGFTFFTARVAAALGFHAHEANQLIVHDGLLTGAVAEPILDKHSKHESLLRHAAQQRIPLARSLAVGDGANDIPMLQAAGLGVAFHAKPVVAAAAHASIRFNDLTALLFAQGIAPKDWVASELSCDGARRVGAG